MALPFAVAPAVALARAAAAHRVASQCESWQGGNVADSTQRTGEFVDVIDAISILMAWRTVSSFRARVLHRSGLDEPREYELEARPRDLEYRLVDIQSGREDRFAGATNELVSAGQPMQYHPQMITFEPLPVRLAFPMSLGIWGRSTDGYRIVGAASDHDEIILSLEHTKEAGLLGTLVVSRSRRMAVQLDTPTEMCLYQGVELL